MYARDCLLGDFEFTGILWNGAGCDLCVVFHEFFVQLFQFFLLLEPEVAELGFVSLLVLAVLLEELALLDLRHEFELDQLGAKLLDFE